MHTSRGTKSTFSTSKASINEIKYEISYKKYSGTQQGMFVALSRPQLDKRQIREQCRGSMKKHHLNTVLLMFKSRRETLIVRGSNAVAILDSYYFAIPSAF